MSLYFENFFHWCFMQPLLELFTSSMKVNDWLHCHIFPKFVKLFIVEKEGTPPVCSGL